MANIKPGDLVQGGKGLYYLVQGFKTLGTMQYARVQAVDPDTKTPIFQACILLPVTYLRSV